MIKSLLLIPLLLGVLSSCDPACADHHAEAGVPEDVSTAVIQILPTTPVLADPALRTKNFIANEIASLSMGGVLKRAMLVNAWETRGVDRDAVVKNLKVERIEGTDMARLTATGTEKITGKQILDDLIRSYLEVRRESEVEMGRRQLKALDDELIWQADLVQDYRKELSVLSQHYGIPYFENQPIPMGGEELKSLARAREKVEELRLEETLLRAELSGLEKDSEEFETVSGELKTVTLQAKAVQELAADKQDEAIQLSLRQSRFQRSRKAYESSLKMLHEMKQKQQEARVALKMPITPIIVREKPQ